MARTQTKLLAVLPVLSLVFGFLEYGPAQAPEPGSVMMSVHAISSLVIVFAWFWLDARGRAYKPSIVLMIGMLSLTVVALPYYMLRSRGLSDGLKSLALSALVFSGTMAAYRVGSLFA